MSCDFASGHVDWKISYDNGHHHYFMTTIFTQYLVRFWAGGDCALAVLHYIKRSLSRILLPFFQQLLKILLLSKKRNAKFA